MKILLVIIVVIVAIALLSKNEKEDTPAKRPTKYSRKAFARRFKIAGISYRCTKKDIGIVIGKVGYDPSNEYDPNAIAILANPEGPNEKLLGFIAKADQASFANFAYDEKELPFIGFIEEFDKDGEFAIFGKIKVYSGAEADVESDMQEDLKQLTLAFGIKSHSARIAELDEW